MFVFAAIVAFQSEKKTQEERAARKFAAEAAETARIEALMKDPRSDVYEPPDWDERRSYILRRDGYKCEKCGSKNSLHVHHVVLRSVRFDHSASNLITLCYKCHSECHGMTFVSNATIAAAKHKSSLIKKSEGEKPKKARKSHVCSACGSTFYSGDTYVLVATGKRRRQIEEKVCSKCYSGARRA